MRGPSSEKTLSWHDKGAIRIVFLLAIVLAGGVLHFAFRAEVAPWFNQTLNADVAAALINLLSPEAQVVSRGSTLGNATAHFLVAQGCEGIDVILLVVAGVLLTPMSPHRKIAGAVAGALFVYGLNVIRISGLWYTLRFAPQLFETMHLLVGQTVIVIAGIGFYAAWVLRPDADVAAKPPNDETNSGALEKA